VKKGKSSHAEKHGGGSADDYDHGSKNKGEIKHEESSKKDDKKGDKKEIKVS